MTRDFHSGNERIQFSLKLFDRHFQLHHSRDGTTEEQNEALASLLRANLRAVLCKNQTKWEMKNFELPTQIDMEVGPHEGC